MRPFPDPERGLWEGPHFISTQFLKSDRISFAYSLTSNKDHAFIDKRCFAFLLYGGICRFCAIFGHFGGHGRAWSPVNPPLKIKDLYPCLMCTFVSPQNLNAISVQIISKKCKQMLPYIGKLCVISTYHRFKQNVPEPELREFGRRRLQLRLLARCHDSGRLRLRLGTHASNISFYLRWRKWHHENAILPKFLDGFSEIFMEEFKWCLIIYWKFRVDICRCFCYRENPTPDRIWPPSLPLPAGRGLEEMAKVPNPKIQNNCWLMGAGIKDKPIKSSSSAYLSRIFRFVLLLSMIKIMSMCKRPADGVSELSLSKFFF